MATNGYSFSFAVSLGPTINGAFVSHLMDDLAGRLGLKSTQDLDFDYSLVNEGERVMLEVSSDGASRINHAVEVILACADRFDLQGCFGFEWALKGTGQRFGGGGYVVDLSKRAVINSFSTKAWLRDRLNDVPTAQRRRPSFLQRLGSAWWAGRPNAGGYLLAVGLHAAARQVLRAS